MLKKGVPVDSTSSYMFAEQSKARVKHQSLMQDFLELQKETETKKKRVQKAQQKKLTLLAEVRFLRRRYKFLMRNKCPVTPSVERDLARSQAPRIHKEAHRLPNPNLVLDLNKISNGEEEDEAAQFQVVDEPLKMEKKPKNDLNRQGAKQQQQHQLNDVNLSVCREIVNGSNRSGKRKISWQDQVVLKV